jgi:predicted nucleotide-binding protein
MKAEELKNFLLTKDALREEREIQYGVQLHCNNGEIFTVYETGKLVVGGKRTPLSQEVERLGTGAGISATSGKAQQEIFVVYGHDTGVRDELELMLRRMGLSPVVFAHLPAAGETIIEKLESYIGQHGKAAYACVLVTPDDEGYKVGEADKKKYRARQNVVLELGMVLARLGRKRVAILRKKTVEQPSDIDGLIYIPFEERVEEIKVRLLQELQAAGFSPKL